MKSKDQQLLEEAYGSIAKKYKSETSNYKSMSDEELLSSYKEQAMTMTTEEPGSLSYDVASGELQMLALEIEKRNLKAQRLAIDKEVDAYE